MPKISIVFVFLLLYNSIISLQAIAVFLRYRNKPISIIGAITSFAVGFYSFGYAMELLNLLSGNISHAFSWYKAQYFAIPYIPVLWYFFVSTFSGRKITKKEITILFILPVLTTIFVWTNELHNFFFKRLCRRRKLYIERTFLLPTNILQLHYFILGLLHALKNG